MKGLFVQVSSLPTPNYLTELVTHIIQRHPEIREIVLSDVSFSHVPSLLQLQPLISMTFDKMYVGAPPFPWYGPRPDTPTDLQGWMLPVGGAAGMLTPSYRWDSIYADEAIAAALIPQGWEWYIGSEIGIDALGDHPRIRQGWEAYLIELCRRLYAYGATDVLWSPYAWDAWATVSTYRRGRVAVAMKTLVGNIKTYSGTLGVTGIDLQDSRGAQPQEPATDAVNWYRLIKGCGATVRINMELFTPYLTPEDKEVIAHRAAYYREEDVPVGCCWEARYWLVPMFANHLE